MKIYFGESQLPRSAEIFEALELDQAVGAAGFVQKTAHAPCGGSEPYSPH